MNISSRTPEGQPNRCPLCGHDLRIEPSLLTRDAPCPRCGNLLWFEPPALPAIGATPRLHAIACKVLLLFLAFSSLFMLALATLLLVTIWTTAPSRPASRSLSPLGPMELTLLLILAVVLFGRRLPDVGRYLGKGIMEFKRSMHGLADDVDD